MVKTIFKAIGVTLLLGYLLGAGYLYGFWRNEPCYRGMLITIDYPSDDAHFVTEASIRQLVEGKPGFRFRGKSYSEVNTLELAKKRTVWFAMLRAITRPIAFCASTSNSAIPSCVSRARRLSMPATDTPCPISTSIAMAP